MEVSLYVRYMFLFFLWSHYALLGDLIALLYCVHECSSLGVSGVFIVLIVDWGGDGCAA